MRPSLISRLRRISLGYGIVLIAIIAAIAISLFSYRAAIISLVASSASSTISKETVIFFVPHSDETLVVGETAEIDIRINASTPINAVGATVHFPQETLEVIGVSKEDSFLDLWTEETTIKETAGEVRFSGGTLTTGGVTDIATVLTLTVRAKKAGRAELVFTNAEIFAHDGTGKPVDRKTRTFVYTVLTSDISTAEAKATLPTESPAAPHADFNDDGVTSLADISILAVQLLAPYNARYDLDQNGVLNLRDFSIIFAKARQ